MGCCFAPGCSHGGKDCQLLRFPKSPITKKNWTNLFRLNEKLKLADTDRGRIQPLEPCEYSDDGKQFLPPDFKVYAKSIEDYVVYDDDVWVVTSPKSGTYWLQETLMCLLHKMDFEKLRSPNFKRAPNIDLQGLDAFVGNDESLLANNVLKYCETLERPRVMRTHLCWDKLPKALRDPNCKAKIVYLARNPKDVCISRYHYYQMLPGNDYERVAKNLSTFANEFLAGRLVFMPYWTTLMDFWNRRDNPNILFLKYEEMITDLPKVLDTLQTFLGLDPLTEQQKLEIADYLSFQKMKENKALQKFMHLDYKIYREKYKHTGEPATFMRRGRVGSWKDEMPPEMVKQFDEWIAENTEGTGYSVDID